MCLHVTVAVRLLQSFADSTQWCVPTPAPTHLSCFLHPRRRLCDRVTAVAQLPEWSLYSTQWRCPTPAPMHLSCSPASEGGVCVSVSRWWFSCCSRLLTQRSGRLRPQHAAHLSCLLASHKLLVSPCQSVVQLLESFARSLQWRCPTLAPTHLSCWLAPEEAFVCTCHGGGSAV